MAYAYCKDSIKTDQRRITIMQDIHLALGLALMVAITIAYVIDNAFREVKHNRDQEDIS